MLYKRAILSALSATYYIWLRLAYSRDFDMT